MSNTFDISSLSRMRLNSSLDMGGFDCACPDLNDFIRNDALKYSNELMSATFVYFFEKIPVAFISYSNDKITANAEKWNSVSRHIPNKKRIKAGYPAVKIGRLGIAKDFHGQKIGSQILDFSKGWFLDENKTGCRFITLDAYNRKGTLAFYEKNGFKYLETPTPTKFTVLMYFDLAQLLA